ncbi:MAG TPA: ATP-binding protein [Pyrinomonadaceae bacterium]|jgi:signal transduction histidine kinase
MNNNQTTGEIIEGVGVKVRAADVVETPQASPEAADCSMPDCVEALRRIGVFADLPKEQLEWFIENAEEREFNAGDVVYRKGDSPDRMLVYLEGEVHARADDYNLDDYVYIARAGDAATEISGKLPFSRMKELELTGRAVAYTRLLLFPVALFPQLVQRMPLLAERLVWIMIDRVRWTTQADERRDKLMALGKLSAGLAHELNNPAAAARRTADELLETLEDLRAADLNLCCHNLTPELQKFVSDFERETIAGAQSSNGSNAPHRALAMSDREDELTGWLEARSVENAWQFAHVLTEAGVDAEKLEILAGRIRGELLEDVIRRVTVQVKVARLAGEIKTSVSRISDLVGAIKEYSYMDRAGVQEIDLHKGLDNTLLILKYKLKKKNISIVREYDENLPKLTAHGSLLNQVWTNLIDNAVDAMPDGGRLKIKTKLEPGNVLIEIRDNGAGIPPEIQPHIFEPFYTTKDVGDGTGLGLDTVQRIVRKHRGNVRFETKPGDTCFQVRLPLAPKPAARQ